MLPDRVSTMISARFLREAGGVGHLLDERRLRQAAVGHGFVSRQRGAVAATKARELPSSDNPPGEHHSSGGTARERDGLRDDGATAARNNVAGPARPRAMAVPGQTLDLRHRS